MLKHWSPCPISKRSSCFMYKDKLSLCTPNTVASHDTWNIHPKYSSIPRHLKGSRKSYGMVNVIRYKGSTSGSDLSTGFDGLLGPCLSYMVKKYKWMIVNTLFVTNHFLILTNTTKWNTCFEKGCTRCVAHARKVLSVYPLTEPLEWVHEFEHQHL